jgi:hypothetical protein
LTARRRQIALGYVAMRLAAWRRTSKTLSPTPSSRSGSPRRSSLPLGDDRRIEARHVGLGDFDPDEFPFDPRRPEDLEGGANFRLETRLGDLDIMQWVAGIDTEPAYATLAANALSGELGGVPLRVSGLDDLVAMKRAAGRPRDLDDLQRLGAG